LIDIRLHGFRKSSYHCPLVKDVAKRLQL